MTVVEHKKVILEVCVSLMKTIDTNFQLLLVLYLKHRQDQFSAIIYVFQ